jgi:hypothetical protein
MPVLPRSDWSDAEIVAVPSSPAVTSPVFDTDATAVLSDDHVTDDERSSVKPFDKVTIARNWAVEPR